MGKKTRRTQLEIMSGHIDKLRSEVEKREARVVAMKLKQKELDNSIEAELAAISESKRLISSLSAASDDDTVVITD